MSLDITDLVPGALFKSETVLTAFDEGIVLLISKDKDLWKVFYKEGNDAWTLGDWYDSWILRHCKKID